MRWVSLDQGEHSVSVVGVNDAQPEVGVGQPLLDRVPEQPLDLRADVEQLTERLAVGDGFGVGDDRDLLDQRPIPRLGLAQRLLDPLALRDVARVVDDPGDHRIGQQVCRDHLPPADRAVLVPDPKLGGHALARAASGCRLEESRHDRPVLVDDEGDRLASIGQFLGSVAESALDRRADEAVAAIGRDNGDHVVGVLDQGAEPRLAAPQLLLQPPPSAQLAQGPDDARVGRRIDPRRSCLHRQHRAVPAPRLQLAGPVSRREQAGIGGAIPRGRSIDDLLAAQTEKIVPGVAERGERGRVGLDHPVVGGHDKGRVHGLVE